MAITFLYPNAAWLFLLLPLLWFPARRRRALGHLAIRFAVLACLVVALMQPSMVRDAGVGAQVIVLDQRASLDPAGRAAARHAHDRVVSSLPRGAARTLIRLGGPGGADSLSTALARAVDAVPQGTAGTVTLISDGLSTHAHWNEAVAALLARGIVVNTVAVPRALRPAMVAAVEVQPTRVGERASVDITVEGDGRQHRLELWSGGRRLARAASFAGDGPAHVAMTFPADRAGFVPIRAVLDGRAAFETVAAVQPPTRLLYLGERQAGAAALLQRLLGPGVTVSAPRPAVLADGGPGADRWPLIWLDDLPAARLPASAQHAIAAAVARRGTGLIVSGGAAAFGPGGYAAAPIGAALPIVARQEDRQIRPSVALAIVIDSSGSMQGLRMDLAKQVARQTVRKLTATDWVGVVEFYGARQWSVPMHPVTDAPDVERAIGRMQPQGASVLFPALQEAYYGLKDLDARYKHILVISDGGVAEDRYQQLLRHIADDRINVSTVAVGSQIDDEESMAEWARIGRGRFYSVPDEFNLVELDFKEPQVKPEPGYRAGRVAVRAVPGSSWWSDVPVAGLPPVSGHALGTARPEAEVLVRTAAGDPLLATWQLGAGRVTTLATEPLGAGTAGWQGWRDYGRWLARIAAMTARQRPDLDVSVSRRFDRLSIAVQRLAPGGPAGPDIRLLDAAGRVVARVEAPEERAPGLFTADIAYPADRPAMVEVRDGDRIARAANGAFSDVRPQTAMTAAMALPLAQLSARSGGWYRDAAQAPGAPHRGSGWIATDLWPWLALLALILYLCELGYRRRPPRRPMGAS